MSKALRLSEKWFRRGLWLVALVFASFLIGLGSVVVGDLPKVETPLELDQFLDARQAQDLRSESHQLEQQIQTLDEQHEQLQLQWERARNERQATRQAFQNWLATRSVTQRAETDPEVMTRTRALDQLQMAEQQAQRLLDGSRQQRLDLQQTRAQVQQQLRNMEDAAREKLHEARRQVEMRVFLYRLALTLPLLLVAGWLFVRKRKSTYWPFVWGFIFFALFAFFVELVPYLPSYGGYVRNVVGLVLTIVIGRYAIVALHRYLERQRAEEALPDAQRRRRLGYDEALSRLAKQVCPSCERPVDLKSGTVDYCPHCGICLFEPCHQCHTRRSALTHFCQACGAPSPSEPQAEESRSADARSAPSTPLS